MTPEDFKKLWEADGDQLILVSAEEVASIEIPASAKVFIELAGLPEEAAPYLSFDANSRGQPTDPIRLAMKRPDVLVVGSNAAGDPVAIRTDGALVYLNHDANFAEFYINKDVETFAETSLRMRNLIAAAQRVGGPDAYLDGLVPAVLRDEFRAFLAANDPMALEPGALWFNEIASWAVGGANHP
jgi:hypothetical protein